MKKLLGVILISAMLFSLSGCSKKDNNNYDVGYQLEKPKSGDQVAIMNTNMGTIKIRFFPEAAPKAVENFVTHAKEGYYNGLTFHRVIKGFMIQGGDPNGNGTGGESIFGAPFEDEFSDKVLNLRGSIAMANSGKDTNGSQFFINQANAEDFVGWDYYQKVYDMYKSDPDEFSSRYGQTVDMSKLSNEVKDLYTKNGGNPTLDGAFSTSGKGHTVFAQVYEGMDIVDKIAGVEVDSSDKPISTVTIESISIENYK